MPSAYDLMEARVRRLWLEVLVIGLTDAARGTDPGWLWSADFAAVCEPALVSPHLVRRAFPVRRDELANFSSRSACRTGRRRLV